jgi:4-hydroxybutyrate CoA-transferase
MTWKTDYQSKIVDAATAVRAIKSNNRIYLTGNCSVPEVLVKALVEYAPVINNVEICQPLTVGSSDYVRPEMNGHLRVNSLFISHNVRQAVQDGRADYTPVLLSELPLLFKKGILPLDAALIHLSPPDDQGFCTLGIEAGLTRTAAKSARILIAEINQQMPRTQGDTSIHIDELDYIVNVDYPLAELPMKNDCEDGIVGKIAEHIAERIPDGATMQLGIGGIPEAILKFLRHKKDLGVHSELFSDGIMELVKLGIVTNQKKTIHKGKIVAGFIIGSRDLYRWVDDNPLIELLPTEYVNDPFVIAKNSKMVAINSAIEVDLTGQVCADSIGPKFYSGVGGQMDFIYGASLSEGGLPVIALPSSAKLSSGQSISKIVATLKQGAGVVTSRNHVHHIATEYGMVDLYGKSIRQRTQALISIAHPDFRDELLYQAKKMHYI